MKNGDIVSLESQTWRKKKISEKDLSYRISNEAMLLETHVSMFEYKNLPKSVNSYFLELYLQTQGVVVWLDAPDNGGILALEGCTANDLDAYGIGRKVIATSRNGKEYTLERDADCVVGYNNRSMSPCFDIFTDAQTLSEIQTSIDFLIFWTRLSPLIRVSDEKLKLKVIDAFKNMQKGVPVTLASKKVLAEFGIPDDITIDMLTQPGFADKIQYTAKLYDDVLRWHMTRYGHATNGNSKAAQQTVDEVDSTASQSMILPLSMLAARREMIEKVNDMFDLDIEVELSGAWRAEVTAYERQSGEASIDKSAGDPEPVSDTGSGVNEDIAPDNPGDPEPVEPEPVKPEDPEATEAPETITEAIEDAAQTIADAITGKEDGNSEEV